MRLLKLMPVWLSLTMLASCAAGTQSQPTQVLPSTTTQTRTTATKSIPCSAASFVPLSRKDTDGTKEWGIAWNKMYESVCGVSK